MQANRFFNNSGPVNDADHFCVSPIKRLDTAKVWQLILQKKYFLICGPKQCGKTSYLLALAKLINRNGHAKCLYFNVESLRGVQENLEECMRSILFEISSRARDTFGDDYLEDMVLSILDRRGPYQALNELLTQWSKRSELPIVLLIDEIDTLSKTVLTPVLSQIRAGYDKRPELFPQSIIFCATHDVIEKQFNIKDTAIRLNLLRRDDLEAMLKNSALKHSVEIGKEAVDRIWRYSAGQPWIISSLAGEILHEIVPAKGLDRVTEDQVDEAFANVLSKKGNHIDYIVSLLHEEPVKKCLIPILTSGSMVESVGELDFKYLQELGIVKVDRKVEFSNGLYKEVIPRALIDPVVCIINLDLEDYLTDSGAIDTLKLLKAFQGFYANHIQRMVSLIDYGAAGYVLTFQALLQKLADASVSIEREYGIGENRVVLTLNRLYPVKQRVIFILKQVFVRSIERFKQLQSSFEAEAKAYADGLGDGGAEIHVVAVNMNPEYEWDGKPPYAKCGPGSAPLHLWGF